MSALTWLARAFITYAVVIYVGLAVALAAFGVYWASDWTKRKLRNS